MRTTFLTMALACAGLGLARAQEARVHFAEAVSVVGYASGVAVEWSVYDDAAVAYYVILRRGGGRERAIATVDPVREVGAEPARYRYIDAAAPAGPRDYRLRAVFEDESYAQSSWCTADGAIARRTRVLDALDDESLARLHIAIESRLAQEVTVRIRTVDGTELDSYARAVAPGPNVLEVDYRAWPTGYYTVEVDDADDVSEWVIHVDAERQRARTRRLPSRR